MQDNDIVDEDGVENKLKSIAMSLKNQNNILQNKLTKVEMECLNYKQKCILLTVLYYYISK